ncbi:ABC transporter substrate-binding protein [Patescibacteria group bacterium]|nr:ABC transporter substrate-binding protein [Patescibacteria group bacterium]
MKTKKKIIICQFGKLALYFPLYLAIRKDFFKKYGLGDIIFKNTYNDSLTFKILMQQKADFGLSDPIFSISEEYDKKGEIIGTLVKKAPFILVGKKKININSLSELVNYRIVTYSQFTTNYTIAKYFISEKNNLIEFKYNEIIDILKKDKVDLALILPEQLNNELIKIFDFQKLFSRFLFTGFTISPFQKDNDLVSLFKLSINDSLKFIHGNKKEALEIFQKEFPNLIRSEEVFNNYINCWPNEFLVTKDEFTNALKVWKSVYQELFKKKNPSFLIPKIEQAILSLLCSKKYSRDYPCKLDKIINIIKDSLKNNRQIPFIGFWGASDKVKLTEPDFKLIERLSNLNDGIKKYSSGLDITFILSDEHAIMNGFNRNNVRQYLGQINRKLSEINIKSVWLSDLWRKWGITPEVIMKKAKNVKLNRVDKKSLLVQSKKYYQHQDKLFGAKVYYAMRSHESSYLKREYSNHIFFSYSSSEIKSILPKAPILFFNTLSRDINETPWFLK